VVFHELIDAANVLMDDLSGDPELGAEPFKRLTVGRDFGPNKLQGDFLVELLVQSFVDPAHAALAQFFDYLIFPRKHSTRDQVLHREMSARYREALGIAEPLTLRINCPCIELFRYLTNIFVPSCRFYESLLPHILG